MVEDEADRAERALTVRTVSIDLGPDLQKFAEKHEYEVTATSASTLAAVKY